MRKNIIFGTLVVAVMLLGTITPIVVAEDRDPGQQYYWIKHDTESVDPMSGQFKQQTWEYYNNLGLYSYFCKGPWDEIWYTDHDGGDYPEQIRPIRDEGWKTNTWLNIAVTTSGMDATLHVTIYASPANDYPESINWTIGGGAILGSYFVITAYDWDDNSTLSRTEADGTGFGDLKDKLGNYLDQFRLELEYFKY